MEAIIRKSDSFKTIVSSLKDITSSAEFIINENGISLQALDSSHVCVVEIKLANDTFLEEFIITAPVTIGLDIDQFSTVLKLCSKDDNILLKLEEGSDTLGLKFKNNTNKKIDFNMKLMDIVDSDRLDIVDIDHSFKVTMDSTEFQKTVRDMATIGEHCIIHVTKEYIMFTVSGEAGTVNIKIEVNDNCKIETTDEGSAGIRIKCGINYLVSFSKAKSLSSIVTLGFMEGAPFCCEYALDDTSFVKFFLAPMDIEKEEDEMDIDEE
jgi:proliferating cell nuclear antigen